ncbi:NAD(P)/FAD-dependent oxidoreductase [Nocardia macrotermitis]|uniref:Rhodocoxin reductase n=1 Tax=Nocardia macrotermitis TaxID=2585198 RepID=A0A7K0D1X9_9NOCA|nr:FAD-dependent oxidoreductase [Nocardia macrotermitis]MQY19661.1 Rhodocoxin reductase [Nocardia macrotermitis]
MTDRIVIAGAGPTGATAARTLRAEGYTGRIVLVGAERHGPYRRPMVSKDLLAGTREIERCLLEPEKYWYDSDIELRLATRVVDIDTDRRRLWLSSGESLDYDALLLATGARARRLEQHPPVRVRTLRGVADIAPLRAAIENGPLLIIGAGLVGLEVAATARGLGAEARILHAGAAPLDRIVPPEISDLMVDLHAEHGVRIENDIRLAELCQIDGRGVVATATDGRTWTASSALVAIGAVPDTALARTVGIVVDDGILVDEQYRTSAAGVYAAGDVASRFDPRRGRHERCEHWNSALSDGKAAAKSLLGQQLPDSETPWGWSTQYGLNLQFAGWPATYDDLIIRGSIATRNFTALALTAGALTGAVSLGRPRDIGTARDLIASGATRTPEAWADESIDLADPAPVPVAP